MVAIGDEEKLGELILYVSQRCATDPKFGSVKLNKILYFSDFLSFGRWGKPITGVDYQHLRQGPAPRRLIPVRDRLQKNGALVVQEVPLMNGNIQKRTVNLREADLSEFAGNEISLVDQVIKTLWNLDADETSELSHQLVGWKMTKQGDSIPYGTIFLSDAPLSPAEIQRGKEIAAELDLFTEVA